MNTDEIIEPSKKDKNELFLISDKYLIPSLNFIKENKKIYKLIHDKPYIFKKQQTFQKIQNEIFSVILDKYGVSKEEKEYIFVFFSFGLVVIIQKWIENDCKDEIPKMAEFIKNVIGYHNKK